MSKMYWSHTVQNVELASDANPHTVLLIKPPANVRESMREVHLSFHDPNDLSGQARVELFVPSDDGTGMTSQSVQKRGDYGETPQLSAWIGKDARSGQTDPAFSYLVAGQNVDIDGGEFHWWAIKGEDDLLVPGNTRLGLRVIQAGTPGQCYATAYILGEE